MKSKTYYEQVYQIVKKIPRGKVATYGQIASIGGLGRNARMVGYALSGTPEGLDIPWHRVINSRGEISYSPSRNNFDHLQKTLLELEGIRFDTNGRVNLGLYQWSE